MASRFNSTARMLSRAAILFCVVTAGALCLYLFCLAPTVTTGGDSGELIAASYRLGIAHPSGYALYCLLGKAFAMLLPWGEIAWRYNVFSAVCGALTTGLVAVLVQRYLTGQNSSEPHIPWPAIGAGWLLAGFIFFGAQALIAEVYAPAGLAIAALIFCAMRWHQTSQHQWLFALFLGLGLALNLHLSTVSLWPGLLILGIWHLRKMPVPYSWQKLTALSGLAMIFFVIGLSVTLYLPWRAQTFPEPPRDTIAGQEYVWWQPLDWGHPADFGRWKAHVSVQQYKSLLWKPVTVHFAGREFHLRTFAQSPAGAIERLKELCGFIAIQWLWCTPLVLLGAWVSWRPQQQRPLAALLTTTFILNVFIAIHYRVDNVFDIANFLFPAYVVMAIWLGIGIAAMQAWTSKQGGDWGWRLSTLAKLAIIGAIATQWMLFSMSASWRGNTRVYDDTSQRAQAIEKLQKSTGRTSTLLSFTDDTLFPFWYLQHVEGRAPGTQVPYGPAMHATRTAGLLPRLVEKSLKAGPVVTTQWDEKLDAEFPYAPLDSEGLLWQLTTSALPPAAQPIELTLTTEMRGSFAREATRRMELIGFHLAFYPDLTAHDIAVDPLQKTRQIGWAEVMLLPLSMKLEPLPNQQDLRQDGSLLIYKQRRRLVVPQTTKAGPMLLASLPLQIPLEMPPREYKVRSRIVTDLNDTSTPWVAAGRIKVNVR